MLGTPAHCRDSTRPNLAPFAAHVNTRPHGVEVVA
jgi:hypothetical protein